MSATPLHQLVATTFFSFLLNLFGAVQVSPVSCGLRPARSGAASLLERLMQAWGGTSASRRTTSPPTTSTVSAATSFSSQEEGQREDHEAATEGKKTRGHFKACGMCEIRCATRPGVRLQLRLLQPAGQRIPQRRKQQELCLRLSPRALFYQFMHLQLLHSRYDPLA